MKKSGGKWIEDDGHRPSPRYPGPTPMWVSQGLQPWPARKYALCSPQTHLPKSDEMKLQEKTLVNLEREREFSRNRCMYNPNHLET